MADVTFKETKLDNGWLIWTVEGNMDLATMDEVHKKGNEIVEREAKTAIDMSYVKYISSAGIRVLLLLLNKAQNQGKEFTAIGAQGIVKTVLEDSRMDKLLRLKDSVDEL